jgi:hypothetical protein
MKSFSYTYFICKRRDVPFSVPIVGLRRLLTNQAPRPQSLASLMEKSG